MLLKLMLLILIMFFLTQPTFLLKLIHFFHAPLLKRLSGLLSNQLPKLLVFQSQTPGVSLVSLIQIQSRTIKLPLTRQPLLRILELKLPPTEPLLPLQVQTKLLVNIPRLVLQRISRELLSQNPMAQNLQRKILSK
jgi:hypothetical protein